ncbi:hypothetical protein ACFL5O_10720, partial [Myxococcota bacterium]
RLSLIPEMDTGERAARMLTEMGASREESTGRLSHVSPTLPPSPALTGAPKKPPLAVLAERIVSSPGDSAGNELFARTQSRKDDSGHRGAVDPGPQSVAGVSFASLWPSNERLLALEVEMALAADDTKSALIGCEKLVSRALAAIAGALGATADAPRDPTVVALSLGIPGPRLLEFRSTVREARAGRDLPLRAALAAYAFAIEVHLAKTHVLG